MDSQANYNHEDKDEKKSTKSYAWILTHILPFSIMAFLVFLVKYYPDLTFIEIISFFIIPSIALCYFDRVSLEKQSAVKLENWYIYIPPLYLWKRYQALNIGKDYALKWSFGLIFSTGYILFLSYGASILPNTACDIVTRIIATQTSSSNSCRKVIIDEKVSKTFYLATAILDNGQKVDIAITRNDDSEIYVEIVSGIFGLVNTNMFSEQENQMETTEGWKPTKPLLSADDLWDRN